MKEAYLDCPKWDRCSVNSCPLDSEQDEHESRPDDPQTKCKAGRSERYKIGKETELPRRGLTKKEWAALQRELKVPPEKRKARMEKMRGHLG